MRWMMKTYDMEHSQHTDEFTIVN